MPNFQDCLEQIILKKKIDTRENFEDALTYDNKIGISMRLGHNDLQKNQDFSLTTKHSFHNPWIPTSNYTITIHCQLIRQHANQHE